MSLQLKFGRLPTVHTLRTMRSAIALNRHLTALGIPPAASDDYTTAPEKAIGGSGNWGILGNDQWGCCVEADDGHTLMLRTANAGTIVIPTAPDVLANYSAETGFNANAGPSGNNPTDQGTDETNDCAYMVSTGLLGHKAAATGMVDPTNLVHVRWCIQLFGACKLGITVTQDMMNQFDSGDPWVPTPDQNALGGHDVPAVRYYSDGSFDVITWGKRQRVDGAFLASSFYFNEAHALVFPDFLSAAGTAPNGFSLAALLADLPAVEMQQAA